MTFPTSNIANTVATGGASTRPFIEIFMTRDPTTSDLNGNGGPYQVQQRWWNTSTDSEFILVGFSSSGGVVTANWQPVSSTAVTETLTGNTGGAVGPDSNNNINIVGNGTSVVVTGDPSSSTLTIEVNDGGYLWSNKSTNFNATAGNGYFITGNAVATLPASPGIGDSMQFFVQGAFTLTLQANTGQFIQFSSNVSSSAGTQANTASGDACEIIYNTTGTTWNAVDFVGAWNAT